MTSARPVVAVFGSSSVREPDPAWARAHALGGALARAGADVMTGGYGGVMEAASHGAHEAGGHVIGVTVELFERRGPVNRWVKERVHTGDLFDRLRTLMERADGFVVAEGNLGTLNELWLAWTLVATGGRRHAPLVLYGDHWPEWLEIHRRMRIVPEHLVSVVHLASGPDDAARLALQGHAPAGRTP
jgi:uncharacterized protein (TIGR00730 family)